jgi:hypothetical protein
VSEAKHTAGPWKQSGVYVRQDLVDRIGPIIARVSGPEVEIDPECEANARLIAAAPETASELAFWLDFAKSRIGEMDADELAHYAAGRAAIAKAGGRS